MLTDRVESREVANSIVNASPRITRQRSLSGDESLGEKSLMTKNPVYLVSPKTNVSVVNGCLCAVDEVVATPAFNVSVIESACNKDFKLFDAINNSKYVGLIDSVFASLGVIAISIGIYVRQYCKLREVEKNSDFFYFSRLFIAMGKEVIERKMGQIEFEGNEDAQITYEYLRAAAYFYPPDISKFACWRRRFFCWGKAREELKNLKLFLNKAQSKKQKLREIHQKLIEQLSQFLNNEMKSDKFQPQKIKNSWIVGLTNNYTEQFFKQVNHLIVKNANAPRTKNINFTSPVLGALGQASFIYWILMFIFYFIPVAPVVTSAAISVVPLALALLGALPCILIYNLHKTRSNYKIYKQSNPTSIEKQHKEMLEKKIVELNKQQVFIACLQEKYALHATVALRDSRLIKDLDAVLHKRRFSRYHAICLGFIDGCFLPFFAGWLLLDGIKVLITYAKMAAAITSFIPISPVMVAVIAGITFLLGVSYGIYSALKAKRKHEARFNDLEEKVNVLKAEAANLLVLNKSLRDYDRLLRRFSEDQPIWTKVKKVLSRFLVIIKRLGTGSLVFRLVIYGPIFAFISLLFVPSVLAPILMPVLVTCTAVAALTAAAWYLFAYNLESKATQASRIVEHLVQSAQLSWIDKKLRSNAESYDTSITASNKEHLAVTTELAIAEKEKKFVRSLSFAEEKQLPELEKIEPFIEIKQPIVAVEKQSSKVIPIRSTVEKPPQGTMTSRLQLFKKAPNLVTENSSYNTVGNHWSSCTI